MVPKKFADHMISGQPKTLTQWCPFHASCECPTLTSKEEGVGLTLGVFLKSSQQDTYTNSWSQTDQQWIQHSFTLILVQSSLMMNKGALSSHAGWMRETSELHACCCCWANNNPGFYGGSKQSSGDYATNVSTEQVWSEPEDEGCMYIYINVC